MLISGIRDAVIFSNPGQPEYLGENVLGVPSNFVTIGDDGEPIVAATGIGPTGNVYCKQTSMFYHAWSIHPAFAPRGDGNITKMASRRGAVGPKSIHFVDGVAYGIDQQGCWALVPGGEPNEIGEQISRDWKDEIFDWNFGDNFLVHRDMATRTLWFFMVEKSYQFPRFAYVYHLEQRAFIMTRRFAGDIVDVCELPDSQGMYRLCIWMKTDTNECNLWMMGNSNSDGVNLNDSGLLYGEATGGSINTIQKTGADRS